MFVGIVVIVGLVGHVDHERRFWADALPAVVHELRDLHEQRAVDAEKKLVDDVLRGRILTRVHQDEFDRSSDADEVVGLCAMEVPGLDDAGVGGG